MVNFKQLLEKATNADLSEPDWESILEIVEEVKTKNVSAKSAIKEFRKRLLDNSGNVVYLSLMVLDSLMKNCASDVHTEVLSVEFMGVMKAVVTSNKDGKSVKAVDKALELIGEWKAAFGDQTGYKAVNTIFAELEREGFHIPMSQVASAAFIKKPPEWVLSDRCFMCRQEFNRFKGKLRHHCRNCGKSVCAQCSGKRVALPHFGVVEATRVCDICFKKVEKGEGASAAASVADMDNDLPVEYLRSSLAQESQTPATSSPSGRGAGQSGGGGSEQQMQEDDDLQLAIAMSLNEQENKSKKASSLAPVTRHAPSPSPSSSITPSAPPPAASTLYASILHDQPPEPPQSYQHQPAQTQPTSEASSDPLARYLDRSYWEQRKEQQASGIPPPSTTAPQQQSRDTGPQATVVTQAAGPSGGAANNTLAESIGNSIDMFVKRLHEVNANGGSIATDPVVLSLYQNLTAMQPQLLKQLDDLQQQKAKQLAVINKLNEAKEARVTLNKMRRDHQDKVRQMEQEQAMLARMQMEQKLALLRQQKQEQLAFQQSLQNKRLEVLNSQRVELEQKVAMQRELERQQLIAQEQKVLQHQFGGTGQQPQTMLQQQQQPAYGSSPQEVRKAGQPSLPSVMPSQQFSLQGADPSGLSTMDPTSLPLQSMSLHEPAQALPLPPKLEYNPTPSLDSMAPPPYNPSATDPSMYSSYQVTPQQQPMSLQGGGGGFESQQLSSLHPQLNSLQPSPLPSLQPNSGFQQPTSGLQQPGGMQQTHMQQPTSMQQQPPSLQPHSMQQPSSLQQPPSMHQQPPSMHQQPPSMQQPPISQPTSMQQSGGLQQVGNMGMGPNMGAPQISGYGSNPSLPSHSSSSGFLPNPSISPPQQQQAAYGAPLPPGAGGPGMGQPQQQQYQDPSSMAPMSQPYATGYQQGYQQQQQQPQTAPEGFVPNGAHPNQPLLRRRESEPPLISFD